MDLFVQLIGFIGILAGVFSFQCKKHGSILFFRTLNEALFALQYFFLGAYTGMVVNLIGCVRNVIFTKLVAKGKKTTAWIVLFSIMFIIFGISTWQGPLSILVIFAKTLSTVAYGNKNPSVVRGITFVTSTSWIIHNACVSSVAGILSDSFTMVSVIVGVIRFDLIPLVSERKNKLCKVKNRPKKDNLIV